MENVEEKSIETIKNEEALPEPISHFYFQSCMAREERHIKRLWIALIVAIVVIFINNAAWLFVWFQYDYTSDAITIDSQDGGNANYIGENGDIYNGENSGTETP